MTSKIFRSTVIVAVTVLFFSLSIVVGVLYNHFTQVQIEQLKEECLIRNRSSRTAEAYISNIISFMKWTGNKPMEA